MGAVLGIMAQAILEGIYWVMKNIVVTLIPFSLCAIVVVAILMFCFIFAGLGGTLLFYVIIFFYVKALFDYRPDSVPPSSNG